MAALGACSATPLDTIGPDPTAPAAPDALEPSRSSDASAADASRPAPDTGGGPTTIAAFGAGSGHVCAVDASAALSCWGLNSKGQVGAGPLALQSVRAPTPVVAIGSVRAVAAGMRTTCALTAAGEVRCWGANDEGVRGDEADEPRFDGQGALPVVQGADGLWLGDSNACARRAGAILCWGANDFAQIGPLEPERVTAPVEVHPAADAVEAMAVGRRFLCARTRGGDVLCRGRNGYGQLGRGGTSAFEAAPKKVEGLGRVVDVAAGGLSACAVDDGGTVRCWGALEPKELPPEPSSYVTTPRAVTLPAPARRVAVGETHSCALLEDGTVACWGEGSGGALGDGSSARGVRGPARASGLRDVVAVGALSFGTCALTATGRLFCWGANDHGQLGDGTTTDATKPLEVLP